MLAKYSFPPLDAPFPSQQSRAARKAHILMHNFAAGIY